MFARLSEKFMLTRGRQFYAAGWAVIAAVSALITVLVMTGVDAAYAIRLTVGNESLWVAIAGALAGVGALYIVRGWMGGLGMLGFARAVFGSVMMLVIASVFAGTLIVPFEGTVSAPLLAVSAFIGKPWIAAIWFAGTLGAHYLMSSLQEERKYGAVMPGRSLATDQLSSLSRVNLYHRN